MKKRNEDDPDHLDGLGELLPAEVLKKLSELLDQLHLTDHPSQGSKIELVYVASGGQHVDTQYFYGNACPKFHSASSYSTPQRGREQEESIRHCITLLMEERMGDEPLFFLQNHWQAVYRILVDKGYCRDSDFDGFDVFIRTVMPEAVNKPYSKGSLKQISQTDFVRPFTEWRYDAQITKTRKPFDRMVAVAQRFKEILEENGL